MELNLSGALDGVVATVGPYAAKLVGALAIALAAWIGARLARAAVRRVARGARLEERLKTPGLGDTLGGIGGALVWLFALPALLSTLQLDGLLAPVNAMMSKLLGFVPNLIGAVIVMAVGVLVGRIVSQLVAGVLTAAGSERLAARLGLAPALGDKTLAGLLGGVVFALILLPTVAAALQPLGLDAVTQPVSRLLDSVMGLIPRLISAAVLIVVFVLLGRALSGLVSTLLSGMGFDNLPHHLGLPQGGARSASELAGTGVMAALVMVGLAQASEVLGLPILTEVVAIVGGSLARVAVAAVVLAAGLWLGTLAMRMVQASGVVHAGLLGQVLRWAVLFFVAALALHQAGLPSTIIVIAFGAVVIGVSLGAALAFGLGGRAVAERILGRIEDSFQQAPRQVNAADRAAARPEPETPRE